jgi:hypothetical protein
MLRATPVLIPGDSGEKVNNLRGDNNGYCEENVRMNMCVILKGYRNRAVWIFRPSSVSLIARLDQGRCLQKKGGYTRRIARTHSGCCCLHIETWRSIQTNNTRTSYTICKVRWDWLWDFRTCSVKWNKFVIYVNKFITSHNVFVFVDSNSCISAIRHTYVWNVFFTMTDVITSQNIDLPSWITLYNY